MLHAAYAFYLVDFTLHRVPCLLIMLLKTSTSSYLAVVSVKAL